MWWHVVLIVVLIVSAIIGMWVCVARQSDQLDAMAVQLEATQKELTAAQSEIERLKDTAERNETASNILFDRMNKGAKNYVQKVHEVETDDGACDWLDALLPDSVRKYYCTPGHGYGDPSAVNPVAGMPTAIAGKDGD